MLSFITRFISFSVTPTDLNHHIKTLNLKFLFFVILFTTAIYPNLLCATDVSGSISSDTTWTIADSPYTLTGTVSVNEGVTLTIEAGVEINLISDGRDINIYGTLVALGTSANHILLTSTSPNGGGSLAIRADGTATLEFIDFENLGINNLSAFDTGLYIEESDVTADNLSFSNCGGLSGTIHIIADANSIDGIGSNNDLEQVRIINNSLNADAFWPDMDPSGFNYRLTATLNVPEENSLVIEPGVDINFAAVGVIIDVYGTLTALGTPAEHILCYSSNETGGGSIVLRDGSNSDLLYIDFMDLGFSSLSSFDTGIYIYEAALTADWLTFQNCGGLGGTRSITANANSVSGFGSNNLVDQIQLISNTLTADAIWPNIDNGDYNYRFAGDQVVADGVTLTIEPGVTIDLPNVNIDLQVLSGGVLFMEGTASDHISWFSSNSNYGGSVALRDGSEGHILYTDFTNLGRSTLSSFDAGLYLDDVILSANFMEFDSCGTNAIRSIEANADFIEGIGNNNSVDMVLLRSGTSTRDAFWPLIDPVGFYYQLEGDIFIAPDHELTIEAGNQVNFPGMSVDLDVQGSLMALGTIADPIRLYSNDASGGGSLVLRDLSTATIDFVEFEDLGRNTLSSFDAGIYMYDCNLVADNMTFTDCGTANIRSIDALPYVLDNIGANNSLDQVRLRGATIGKNSTWPQVDQGDFSYLIFSDIFVAETYELTIEPGVQVNFKDFADDLNISGTLKAIGTETDKIRFTSDAPGSGGGSIVFQAPSLANELSYCQIDSLAKSSLSSWDAAIYTLTGDLTIQKSRIVESQRGIRVQSGQPTIINNIIKDNSIQGVFNLSSNSDVIACDNYWGDPSGPFNAINNPSGLGNAISDNVTAANCTADALEIICPENMTLNIGEDYSPDALGSAVVCIQDCETLLSNEFTDSNPDPQCTEEMIRTWIVIDNCGNEKTCPQTINFIDTISPTITCEADLDLGCNQELPAVDLDALITDDNCEVFSTSLLSETESINECIHTYTRIFEVEDPTGNTATCSQDISIKIDLDAPVFSELPSDTIVNCTDYPTAPSVLAVDACDGTVEVSFTEEASSDPCILSLVRTWTAIDECGNIATHTQVITGDQGEIILFDIPADITLECTELPLAEPSITASNNCELVPVTFEELVEGEPCNGSITRTWTASDGCGNSVSRTQVITVVKSGCTNPDACNYDPEANIDDASCEENEAGESCDDGNGLPGQIGFFSNSCSCEYTYLGDMNQDNSITTTDLTVFLVAFGGSADQYPLADMNQDNFITSADLSRFLTVFGSMYE